MYRLGCLLRNEARIWLALALAGFALAQGQPANPAPAPFPEGLLQHLSLADAQRMAFERNWDLLAAAAGVDAATAQKIVAHEFPNPTLSLSTFKINVDEHPSSTVMGNGL